MKIDLERLKVDADYWNEVAPDGATHHLGKVALASDWHQKSDNGWLFFCQKRASWVLYTRQDWAESDLVDAIQKPQPIKHISKQEIEKMVAVNEFKAGDKVYCPHLSKNVQMLTEHTESFVSLETEGGCSMYMYRSGKVNERDHLPAILHATKENQEKLEALYGVKFEDAPKQKPVGSELTRWLLANRTDGSPVLCHISHHSDSNACSTGILAYMISVTDQGLFESSSHCKWEFAVPVSGNLEYLTAKDYHE